MNYYPEQLRRIADICEGLNRADGVDAPETAGITLQLQNGIPLVDEHGTVYGFLADEVGGAWSFYAETENPYRKS